MSVFPVQSDYTTFQKAAPVSQSTSQLTNSQMEKKLKPKLQKTRYMHEHEHVDYLVQLLAKLVVACLNAHFVGML